MEAKESFKNSRINSEDKGLNEKEEVEKSRQIKVNQFFIVFQQVREDDIKEHNRRGMLRGTYWVPLATQKGMAGK